MGYERKAAMKSRRQSARNGWHARFVMAGCLAVTIAGCQQAKNDHPVPTLAVNAASAQSTPMNAICFRPAGPPLIPDGATASADAMKAARAEVFTYAQSIKAYLHCLSDEIERSKAEYRAVADKWIVQTPPTGDRIPPRLQR